MPPWTEEELKSCLQLCYGGYNDNHRKNYEKWGGATIRLILLDRPNLLDTMLES